MCICACVHVIAQKGHVHVLNLFAQASIMRAKWALMSACPQMMCTCMINRPHTLTPLVPVPSVGAESAAKSEQVGEFQGDAKESETCVPPPMIDLML